MRNMSSIFKWKYGVGFFNGVEVNISVIIIEIIYIIYMIMVMFLLCIIVLYLKGN